MSRSSLIRTAAWAAIAGVLGIALASPGPAPVLAGGNPPPAECGDLALYFKIDDIADSGIEPGVYTGASADVETNWDGQEITISNVAAGGQAFDWAASQLVAMVAWKEAGTVFWSDDGLPGYTGSVADRIEHGISHVIFCGSPPQPTPTPTATPTEPVVTPTPTATPSTSVEAETGTPRTTPPPTDTGPVTVPSSQAWPLLLVVIAAIMGASLLVTTPLSHRR